MEFRFTSLSFVPTCRATHGRDDNTRKEAPNVFEILINILNSL